MDFHLKRTSLHTNSGNSVRPIKARRISANARITQNSSILYLHRKILINRMRRHW